MVEKAGKIRYDFPAHRKSRRNQSHAYADKEMGQAGTCGLSFLY